MTATTLQNGDNKFFWDYSPMIISSIIVTLILLFVDEGYYNFSWMLNIGNWIVGTAYVAIITLIQVAIYKLILFPLSGTSRTGLSIGLGIFLTLAILFSLIY